MKNEMNQPLVSIRCITYNHAPYIRQCLDGFVMQKTNFKFEAIVHDDASTDGTADIVREYAEKYPDIIKPICETENQYSKHDGSLRRIVEAAISPSSKYIAMCEGDDYWTDPYKLQKQVEMLEADDGIVAVATNCSVVDKNGQLLQSVRNLPVVPGNMDGEYTLHNFFKGEHQYPTLTVVFRKSASENIHSMYEKLQNQYLGDWLLWICLHTQGNFYFLNEVTAAYRINPMSVTHTCNVINRWKEDFKIRRNLIQLLPTEYHKYLKNNYKTYFKLGVAYKKSGDMPRAIMYLLKSFFAHPVKFIKLLTDR